MIRGNRNEDPDAAVRDDGGCCRRVRRDAPGDHAYRGIALGITAGAGEPGTAGIAGFDLEAGRQEKALDPEVECIGPFQFFRAEWRK